MFWSVGPFWYMVYGIWYVVYNMKMAFTVYLYMFHVHHTWAVYNIVHLFLVYIEINLKLFQTVILFIWTTVLVHVANNDHSGQLIII